MSVRRNRERGGRRAWIVTSVVAIALIIVTAIVFTVSAGTRSITKAAQALHLADESLLVTTAAQAQLGFAMHFAIVEDELRAGTESASDPKAEAAQSLNDLEGGLGDFHAFVGGLDQPILDASTAYISAGRGLLDSLAAGDLESAKALSQSELRASYDTLTSLLIEERDEQFAATARNDATMGRLGDIARFLVSLLIPLAVIVIYRELVRRQQRQAELEVRLDAERTMSKARDDFVANTSHELRTPLTSIYGLSQLIEEDEDNPEATRELGAMISTEAADLGRMVEDLLTAARLDAGALTFHKEQVLVHEEVEEMVRPFQQVGADIEVTAKPAVVRVDRLRQRQVIRNIISNSVKYGGPVIRVTGQKDGNWYEWVVADNGDGVPPELEARLFQRFVHQGTTVVSAGGNGLGLSIVKALAEGMGGTVGYERRDGWTMFIIRVPMAVPTATQSRVPVGAAAGAAPAGIEVAASTPLEDRRRA